MARSQQGTTGSSRRRGSSTSSSSHVSEDKERRTNGVLECATLSSSSSSSVGSGRSGVSRGSRESRRSRGSRESRGSSAGGGRYTSRYRPPASKEQGEDPNAAKKRTDKEPSTSSSSSTGNKPKKRKWRSWRLKSRPSEPDGGDGLSTSSSSSGGGGDGDPSRQGIEMRTTWSLDSADVSDSGSLNSITTYQRRSERKRRQQEERGGRGSDGKTSSRDARGETEYIKNLLGTPKFADTPTCNDAYNVCGMFESYSDKSMCKKNPQQDVVRTDGESVVVSINQPRSNSLLKNQLNPSGVTTPSVIRCCNIGVDGESLCFINRNFCVGAGEGGIAKKRRVHFNEHVEEVEPGIIKNWENSADYQEKKAAAKKKKGKSKDRKRRHRSSCMPKLRFGKKHRKQGNSKSGTQNQPSSSNAAPKTDQDSEQKDPIAKPELTISGSVSNDTQSTQSMSESTSTGNNVVLSSHGTTPAFVRRARHNDSLKWKDYEVPEKENDSKVCQIVINVGRDEVHASM